MSVFFNVGDKCYPEIKSPNQYWHLEELQELQNEDQTKQGALFAQGQTYETIVSQIIDRLEERLDESASMDAGNTSKATIEQLQMFT